MRSSSICQPIEVVFQLCELIWPSFTEKCFKKTFPGRVRSGQVRSDNGNSDNRANSVQVQINLPTRAELGNITLHYMSIYISQTFRSLSIFVSYIKIKPPRQNNKFITNLNVSDCQFHLYAISSTLP